MATDLEREITEACAQFGSRLARVLKKRATQDEWVDQTTCAPLPKRTFLRLVANGELPARVVGKLRCVRRRDLDRYIEKQAAREPTPRALTEDDVEAKVLADLNLVPIAEKDS